MNDYTEIIQFLIFIALLLVALALHQPYKTKMPMLSQEWA